MNTTVRTRFAPSPTGSPHIGNIRTALFAWLYARHHNGQFILRIEDTDRNRYVEGSVEQIMRACQWLGLNWDEGPYYQSERLPLYKQAADQLIASGHAYKCFCTSERLEQMRKQQEADGTPTGYDRHCRDLSADEVRELEASGAPYVVRFAMPNEGVTSFQDAIRGEVSFENRLLDDFVMLKSDGFPTYHLACIVDDHDMEITHVIRGEEWISSTPKHVLLYQAMGWQHPVFAHLPIILGSDRKKLSKRHGSVQFVDYIDEGYLPEAMFNFLTMLGWSTGDDREEFSSQEIIELFDLDKVTDHAAIFDGQKLLWYNGISIRKKPISELTALCIPYLQKAKLLSEDMTAEQISYTEQVVALEAERLKLLPEVVELTRFFFTDIEEYDQKGAKKWFSKPEAAPLLQLIIAKLNDLPEFDIASVEAAVRAAADELGLGAGQAIHTTRLAVSGRLVGPGLFEMITVLGRDRVIERLNKAIMTTSNIQ